MALNLENNLENTNKIDNNVNSFIKELSNCLEKNIEFSSVIANEIYKETPLAIKYRDKLEEVIKECFENMSYEKDFYYFDYNAKEKIYYLDYYNNGSKERIEYSKRDLENSKLKVGTFWRPYENDKIVEARYMKDGIKSNVQSKLFVMNYNNNQKK